MGEAFSYATVYSLTERALAAGAVRRSLCHFEWDIAGRCEAPLPMELFSRPTQFGNEQLRMLRAADRKALLDLGLVDRVPIIGSYTHEPKSGEQPLWVTLSVKCRKCASCLRERAVMWANKAKHEIAVAPRTWFCTFTFNPDEQFRILNIARNRMHESGCSFERVDVTEQFRLLCRAASPDITRFVKRVRKESKAPLRYLFVAEKHESGLPHWHALFHEVDRAQPLRKRVLRDQWVHGFSRFKLVESQGTAWYVCKYLSKDLATRVRGSQNYGKQPVFTIVNENLMNVTNRHPEGREEGGSAHG